MTLADYTDEQLIEELTKRNRLYEIVSRWTVAEEEIASAQYNLVAYAKAAVQKQAMTAARCYAKEFTVDSSESMQKTFTFSLMVVR